MYDVDMELRLLSYDPIDVDGVPVQHVSIDKIQKFGLQQYIVVSDHPTGSVG